MPNPRRPKAEHALQLSFSKSGLVSGLLVAGLVVGAHRPLLRMADREERSDARAEIIFTPAPIANDAAAPLRIAGAWRLTSSEPRMGGVSALAVDGGDLVALSDSGVVIRFAKPGQPRQIADFRDLPDGPGAARSKSGRDSEALAGDDAGRGWWVAFEIGHSAWLFDRDFKQVKQRIALGRLGWNDNKGAEGILSTPSGLLLFPEGGDEIVRAGPTGALRRVPLDNDFGRLADAASLPDGRIVVIARNYSPAGFSSRLLLLEGRRLVPLAALKLGRLDNPEALATERLPGGITRLWIMTDNDYRRRVPTLLIALDLDDRK